MAIGGFQRAHKRVLVHEGGYVNDPQDPGGRTLQGVTQAVYDGWRSRQDKPQLDLRRSMIGDPIWEAERDAIYRLQYWDAVQADKLPHGVDYVLYDGAVNSGPKQSIKWLQRALGFPGPDCDGVMGQRTLAAIESWPNKDNDRLIAEICARRLAFLKALKTWPRFGKGWTTRVVNVQKVGQIWAYGSVGDNTAPVALFTEGGEAKGKIDDASKVPSPAGGDLSTGGGVGLGSITGVIEGFRDQLTPFTGSEMVSNVVLALGLAAALLTIAGLGYRFYARYKRNKTIDVLDLHSAVAAGVV